MSWPSTSDFEPSIKRKYRRRNPEPQLSDEERHHRSIAAREFELVRPEYKEDPRVQRIVDFMRGEAFAAWFEVTTGEDSNQWVDNVLDCGRLLQMSNKLHLLWHSVLDLIRQNRWTNPETKALWAKELWDKRPSERRRIMMRLATPRWASIEAMMEIYIKCAETSAATGIPHHVDHIVPIQNARVCGLHCESNLRIITASANCSKSNKFIG